jgi:hypothetical protein
VRTYLGLPGAPLTRAWATSPAGSVSLPTVATTTKPSGDGVVDLSNNPPSWLAVYPFGSGADNSTFDLYLVGWRLVGTLWVPAVLLEFTATLCTFVGVAGSDVLDTERFADTLGDPGTNLGSKGVDAQQHSPANNTPGFYLVDPCGCAVFKPLFNMGSATGGNCLLGAS